MSAFRPCDPSRLVARLARGVFVVLLGLAAIATSALAAPSPATPPVDIECLAVSPAAGALAPSPDRDGAWRQLRRDRRLTGRSPLVGGITCPQVRWTADLGLRRHLVSVQPDGGATTLMLPADADFTDRYWEFEPEGRRIDLDGDGAFLWRPADADQRIADFRPDLPGWERVTCDTAEFSPPRGELDPIPCVLQTREDGAWRTLWTTEPLRGFVPGMTTSGNPVVADLDADGDLEVAVVGWYEAYLLDLATGAIEQTSTFLPEGDNTGASPRAYGWLGAFDLFGDKRLELVILGDKEQFLSVHGWLNGQLSEIWDHQIAAGVSFQSTKHHPGPNAIADVDGDGSPEIATTIYNEGGDLSWHVVVFDGSTGAIEHDEAGWYLSGLYDVTGDGVAELLVSKAGGQAISAHGPSRVLSLNDGQREILWSAQDRGFVLYDIPLFSDAVNSWTTYARRSAFVRSEWTGSPVLATQGRSPGDRTRLAFHSWDGATLREIGAAEAPGLEIVSLSSAAPELGILMRSFTEPGEASTLASDGVAIRLEGSGRSQRGDGPEGSSWSLLRNTIVAGADDPLVIAERFDETLLALEVSPRGVVSERWRAGGRGMSDGQYPRWASDINALAPSVLAELEGDGRHFVVTAWRSAANLATVRALAPDGSLHWETEFPLVADPPIWIESGITNWTAGHFRHPDREDVLVGARQVNATHLVLLDGRTGAQVWEQSQGGDPGDFGDESDPGSTHKAIFDWDGDGLDEILNLYNGLFSVHDGEDGSILLNRWTNGAPGEPETLFQERAFCCVGAHPVVADLRSGGDVEVLYGKNEATLAVLETDGDPLWRTPFFDGMPQTTLQGVGDLDGDGRLEVVVAGHCDGAPGDEIRVYEGESGSLRWTLDLPGTCEWPETKHVVTGDLDGDGRDEALVTEGSLLHSIGEASQGKRGEIRWSSNFAWTEIGETVLADVDGSGHPQILVNTADGWLYGLGAHCQQNDETLCLNGRRYQVRIDWRDAHGNRGAGHRVPFGSDDSGMWWFFDSDNWEMLVKVLDGCELNQHAWVFAAATTSVEFTLEVTDTTTGAVKSWTNPLGSSAKPIIDTTAFSCDGGAGGVQAPVAGAGHDAGVDEGATRTAGWRSRSLMAPRSATLRPPQEVAAGAASCLEDDTTMCLNGGRFSVAVNWHAPQSGNRGAGRVVPFSGGDSGLWWFFESDNWEMLVKVLDGCSLNQRFWVFSAATTNVGYTLRVTDTLTGQVKEYDNPPGAPAAAVTDTDAFGTCSAP